jgi:hypothetical protein
MLTLFACTTTTTVVVMPPTTTPPTTETPRPSPSKTPARQQPEVKGLFSDYEWIKGEQLAFGVGRLPHGGDCTVHTYTVENKPRGAYQSDCSSWESDGYDILIFYVALKNLEDRATTFNVRNFVLVARDGRSFGPVDVRSKAGTPPNFLPETGKILPHTDVLGYLTFDGRATGVVPARVSYVDGDQTLTVVFNGKPGIR